MSPLKRFVRRLFERAGYRLIPSSSRWIESEKLEGLAQAYEGRLNEIERLIPPNALRIKLLTRLLGTPVAEAYYIIQGLARTKHLEGSVCEFGVAQGETSALIANEIHSGSKALHLFDSFEGLPAPTEEDQLKDDIFALGSMAAYAGTMSCSEEMVRVRLNAISFPPDRTVIHKGFIEPVLKANQLLPSKVSFAYVDFDFYEPIKVTLNFLDHVVEPGSVIVVDDYDFFSTGAKTATDEFLADKNRENVRYEIVVPEKRYGYFAILTRR